MLIWGVGVVKIVCIFCRKIALREAFLGSLRKDEIQGSVNGGFPTVVRVLSAHRIPLPRFDLNLTSYILTLTVEMRTTWTAIQLLFNAVPTFAT